MDDWDADDFEPPPPVIAKEPEKTFWDDEDKEEEVKEEQKPAAHPKPKKEKKKEVKVEDEVLADPVAEKLRQQRLVEESDFKATKELFGGTKAVARVLDEFIPKTESEFAEYGELVAAKATLYSKSFHYNNLLKVILKKCTASLSAADAKEINAAMTIITNEKIKAEKEAAVGKKKASKKQPTLKVDKEEDVDDFRGKGGGGYGDDDYDFM